MKKLPRHCRGSFCLGSLFYFYGMSFFNRGEKIGEKGVSVGYGITNIKFMSVNGYKLFFCFFAVNINVLVGVFGQI